MKNQTTSSSPRATVFNPILADVLTGATCKTPGEPNRPTPPYPAVARPCDGCDRSDPAVGLWAEHVETGEQLWFCGTCGEW